MKLHGVGVWSAPLRYGDPGESSEAAAELDELGYQCLWLPDIGGDVFGDVRRLLDATSRTTVATGILNVWMHDAAEVARQHAALNTTYTDRFLLGLGISHAPLIDAQTEYRYERPLQTMRDYLDTLDAAASPVPTDQRVLAALGPRMLDLARERSGGAHTYLVSPAHTDRARRALGPDAMLMPEVKVMLTTDDEQARSVAREHLAGYLSMPNYANNLLRLGYTDDDITGGGSDRLVDDVVAWGGTNAARRRVREHFDAGADHVCVQVLTEQGDELPRAHWRELAPALLDAGSSG